MEYIVILHAADGAVRTAYPAPQQANAITLWQSYVADGKNASLVVESHLPSVESLLNAGLPTEKPFTGPATACPFCNGFGLHPYHTEPDSDGELADCPVCGGCGDVGTAVEAQIERLAKGSVPYGHFVYQGLAERMFAHAERLHSRYAGKAS